MWEGFKFGFKFKGSKITFVKTDSWAQRNGMQVGWRILKVGKTLVIHQTDEEIKEQILNLRSQATRKKKEFILTVVTAGISSTSSMVVGFWAVSFRGVLLVYSCTREARASIKSPGLEISNGHGPAGRPPHETAVNYTCFDHVFWGRVFRRLMWHI